jgi:hypothetical protein
LFGLGGSDIREFAKHANLRRLDDPDALLALTNLGPYGDGPGKALKSQIRALTLEIVPPNFAVAHREVNGGPIPVWSRANNILNINAGVCPRRLKRKDRDDNCGNSEGGFGHRGHPLKLLGNIFFLVTEPIKRSSESDASCRRARLLPTETVERRGSIRAEAIVPGTALTHGMI